MTSGVEDMGLAEARSAVGPAEVQPRHPSRLRRVPRWLRWALAALVALAVSLVFGVTTARTNLYLGPHQTEYRLTTDSTITVNFGPLGTIQLDSPAGPLGVRANVGEIPTALGADETGHSAAAVSNNPLEGLTKDLGAYVTFFSHPQVTINEVIRALAFDAGRRTLLALGAISTLGAAVFAILGRERREELIDELGPATAGLGASITAAAVVAALVAHGGAAAPETATLASKAFEDTPLAGARVTGQVAAVLDNYGAQALDIYHENEDFYVDARRSLNEAWDTRLTADSEEISRQRYEDTINFLVVTDLHCNVSMAELIRDSAVASNAVAILNLGDTSMNGTEVEKYCVDALNRARPAGIPMITIDGNHDSPEIHAAELAHGQHLLDGEVVEVSGVRILGASSPAATHPGAGLVAKKEWITDLGRELRDTACTDGNVDLLMVHEPETGDAVMHSGCVPLQISGHTHKRYDPFQIGNGIRYVNASTAGAMPGKPTLGPLHGTAEMTVLRWDPSENRFIDWRLIKVHPNGEAEVGPYLPMPQAVDPNAPVAPMANFDLTPHLRLHPPLAETGLEPTPGPQPLQ